LRSAFPPALWNPREVPSCLAEQALSLIYTPRLQQFREKEAASSHDYADIKTSRAALTSTDTRVIGITPTSA
jgi:hypothetical protein